MQVSFKSQELSDLYENRKVTNKAYRSNAALIKQYIKTVNTLRSAVRIEQLYRLKSLNYEHLKGNRHGHCSVRINDQYRLIFEEVKKDDVVILLALEEISKHYE